MICLGLVPSTKWQCSDHSLLYLLLPNSMYSALVEVTDPYQSLPLLPNFSFSASLKGNRLRLQNKQPSLLFNHICNLVSSIFLKINSLSNLPFCFHSFRYLVSSPSRLLLCPLVPNPSMDPASRLQAGGLVLWQLVKSSYLSCSAPDFIACTLTPGHLPSFFLPGKQQAQIEKKYPVCLF